jgi:hypothetical protein
MNERAFAGTRIWERSHMRILKHSGDALRLAAATVHLV